MNKAYTNTEIIKGILNRDEQISIYLTKKLKPLIIGMVLNLGGIPENAEDIFQETMLILYNKLTLEESNVPQNLEVEKYCVGIARNKFLKQFQKQTSDNQLRRFHFQETNYSKEESEKKLDVVYTCLDSIGVDCDSLLTRYYLGKEKLKDLATDFKWSPAFIKVKKHRCMNKLVKCIDYKLIR